MGNPKPVIINPQLFPHEGTKHKEEASTKNTITNNTVTTKQTTNN